MYSRLRRSCIGILLALGMVWICVPALSQTAGSISFGTNLGTLHYTTTTTSGTCVSQFAIVHFTTHDYTNFVYTDATGASTSFSGDTFWQVGLGNRNVNSGNCGDPDGGILTFSGNGYAITVTPHSNGAISVAISAPGYVNPKYVVLGLTYAPPGPQSFVNYANSTLVSNTSSVSSSFSSSSTVSVSTTIGGGILGFANGSSSAVASKSYMQQMSTSSSVTVEKTTGLSLQVPGPANAELGVDHDFDIIWVWLNPIVLFTLGNNDSVQWNGYGYSTLDQPGMDVVGVFAGCLNGDLSQTSCNSLYATPFARTWAAGEIWPAGQGPALTTSDLQNILAADPYGHCGGASVIGASACPSPDPTRYTLTLNQDIQYQQPPPGGQPFTVSYTNSYSNTSTQGMGAMYTSSQTFGYEKSFSFFKGAFDLSVSREQTLTWENEWNKQFTSSTTSTAEASITGPTCNVVGSVCSPAYPPGSPDYGQAIGFSVYQDNLFGTFLFVPATY